MRYALALAAVTSEMGRLAAEGVCAGGSESREFEGWNSDEILAAVGILALMAGIVLFLVTRKPAENLAVGRRSRMKKS